MSAAAAAPPATMVAPPTQQISIPAPPAASAPKTLPIWLNMGTSCLAGCGAWMFAHPFDVLKNYIVLNPHETPLLTNIKYMLKNPYKGISGGISRQIVYASCRLGFYGPIKNVICDPSVEPTMYQRAAAGALSGAAAAFLSSPVEVALVVMTKSRTPMSVAGAMRQVVSEKGPAGLWGGVGPLCNRAAVVGVCQVAMYDQSRSYLTKYSQKKVAAAGGDKAAGLTHNEIVVYASIFTGFFYSFITMPLELARVKLSCYKKPTPDAKTPGMVGILSHTARTEGFGSIFKSFVPYFGRCTTHTIVCFFMLEQINIAARGLYFGADAK